MFNDHCASLSTNHIIVIFDFRVLGKYWVGRRIRKSINMRVGYPKRALRKFWHLSFHRQERKMARKIATTHFGAQSLREETFRDGNRKNDTCAQIRIPKTDSAHFSPHYEPRAAHTLQHSPSILRIHAAQKWLIYYGIPCTLCTSAATARK